LVAQSFYIDQHQTIIYQTVEINTKAKAIDSFHL